MIIRASKPSEMTTGENDEFVAFVNSGGEVNPNTLPGLVERAVALITLRDDRTLIGTAAIKRPSAEHRRGEFRKAQIEIQADSYPLELGWVVVHKNHRGQGCGRALVSKAMELAEGQGVYSTTKSESMKKILPEIGFAPQGEPYRSVLAPDAVLTLFVLPARD